MSEFLSRPWATYLLNVVAATALIGGTAWLTYTLSAARNVQVPARIVEDIKIEPAILLAGKPFHIHIRVFLNKLCPYEVHWSLVRKADNVEVVKIVEPTKQPPAALGEQELAAADRWIPVGVAPGEYMYVSEVFDICGAHTYTSVRRNVDVTIR
jgi:hypothetical protein